MRTWCILFMVDLFYFFHKIQFDLKIILLVVYSQLKTGDTNTKNQLCNFGDLIFFVVFVFFMILSIHKLFQICDVISINCRPILIITDDTFQGFVTNTQCWIVFHVPPYTTNSFFRPPYQLLTRSFTKNGKCSYGFFPLQFCTFYTLYISFCK